MWGNNFSEELDQAGADGLVKKVNTTSMEIFNIRKRVQSENPRLYDYIFRWYDKIKDDNSCVDGENFNLENADNFLRAAIMTYEFIRDQNEALNKFLPQIREGTIVSYNDYITGSSREDFMGSVYCRIQSSKKILPETLKNLGVIDNAYMNEGMIMVYSLIATQIEIDEEQKRSH